MTSQPSGKKVQHPISPFMFPKYYRFQITSFLSILHRLTGIALSVGTLLLALWFVSIAEGGKFFTLVHDFLSSWLGQVLLFGWSLAFYYHLASGIRHLFWDSGRGFELTTVYRSGYAVLVLTVLMTGGTWLYVFFN